MVNRFYPAGNKHTMLDHRHEIFSIYGSPCGSCKHFVEDDYYCPAYPDGIPDRLLEGKDSHDEVRKDQTGTTVYEED